MPLQLVNHGKFPLILTPFLPVAQLLVIRASRLSQQPYGAPQLGSKYMNDAGDPSRYWLDSRIKKLQQGCGRVNVSDQVKKDLARPWSRTASSSASGASSWQPGHPVAARDSLRRMNLAVVPSATSGSPRLERLAGPSAPRYDTPRPRQVAPPSRSQLAPNSRYHGRRRPGRANERCGIPFRQP